MLHGCARSAIWEEGSRDIDITDYSKHFAVRYFPVEPHLLFNVGDVILREFGDVAEIISKDRFHEIGWEQTRERLFLQPTQEERDQLPT